jgi:peptidoglycan/LPS O-acetylase OafA/YrhL
MRLPVIAWLALAFPIYAMSTFILPPRLAAFFPFVLSALICIAIFATPVHNKLVKTFFTNPFFSHLGRTTYSIYLWQQLATADYGFTSPIVAVFLVALTFVFAHYSYRYFELPFIQRGNHLAARYVAPPIVASDKKQHDETSFRPDRTA